jgi:probable F420-dependent oxidoreductase
MDLPLQSRLEFGFLPRMSTPDEVRESVALAERLGYASLSLGDHLAFAVPILDPLVQLAAAAALTRKLKLMTGVYLLPLRHPAAVAKQIATLDRLAEGRLILGVGVGGEFPNEFALVGVPVKERWRRLSEGIEVLRKLWSGEKVSHQGRFYAFPEVQQLPTPLQSGGPPIWCGGRSDAALERAGRIADGYLSYVVTPEMYRSAIEKIASAVEKARRPLQRFGTGHLLFVRLGSTREVALDAAAKRLSVRYAMDFRRAADRYCALGRASDVAATIARFRDAGVRHFVLDMIGEPEERGPQLEEFGTEVMSLLQ